MSDCFRCAAYVHCRVLLSCGVVADDDVRCGILLRGVWVVDADDLQRRVRVRGGSVEPDGVSRGRVLRVGGDVCGKQLSRGQLLSCGVCDADHVPCGELVRGGVGECC